MANRRTARAPAPAASEAERAVYAFAAVLIAAAASVYANSLFGAFHLDDDLGIVRNTTIRSLTNLAALVHPARESPLAGRPFVNISFALNYAIGGLSVAGYHVVNIAIHGACTLLMFGLVRRTLRSSPLDVTWRRQASPIAFAAALLWTVHPLASEPVDYIVQRTELMMAFFFLCTLYASVRALEGHATRWTVCAVLACAAGMACKESMVTAPVIVVLYDRAFRFGSFRAALRARWPLYAGLALSWIELAVLLSSGPRAYSAGFSTGISPAVYLANQARMLVRYARLSVWPHPLVLWYGPPVPLHFADVWGAAAFVVALMALVVIGLWKAPAVGFLGAWIFITLAPTSSVVPIATEVGAERRMYLPLMAVTTFAVILAEWGWRAIPAARSPSDRTARAATYSGMAATAVVVLLLSATTIARNHEYASPLGMAASVVKRWPTGAAHHMLGSQLAAIGDHRAALEEFRKAADTFPRARYNLGIELLAAGKRDEAVAQLRRFIAEEPQLLEVITAHIEIGRALASERKWLDAISEFQQVLSMTPSNLQAKQLLANALTEYGIALSQTEAHDAEVAAVFRRAVDLTPDNPVLHTNLARALILIDDVDGAVAELRRALELKPGDAATHDLLGSALASRRDFDKAAEQFTAALRLNPGDADAQAALAQLRRPR